jgi:hypothetical protein
MFTDLNSHAQLVADWVEVFAPVVVEPSAPAQWPDVLVLDSKRVVDTSTGRQAFAVLAGGGYAPGTARPKVWLLQAFPQRTQVEWEIFLRRLKGAPSIIVSDADKAITNAALRVFPTATLRRCEWHLGDNLAKNLPAAIRTDKAHPITAAIAGAFSSPARWQRLLDAVDEATTPDTPLAAAHKWIRDNQATITNHIATRPAVGPYSNSVVESQLREVDRRMGGRALCYTNKARTDLLLALYTAQINGFANELEWSNLIRAHLTALGGRPAEQRLLTDSKTRRSLR